MSVQASPRDRASWLRLAPEVEAADFDGLYVSDHPGSGPAPFVALAAAAAVTERIRLGSCVLNAGMWEPVALATEVATLDVVSGGRAVLGIGAGHTPSEWTVTGRGVPTAGERVDRMIELIDTTRALLRGETVSHAGRHITLDGAALAGPRPVGDRVPLLVGGNGARVLRFAGTHADVVGLTGAVRTLPDGHQHEVDWSPSGLRRIVDLVATAATAAERQPEIDALVQHVEITDDRAEAAARLAADATGASVDDILTAPFIWLGTVEEIRDQLLAHAANLGIRRYTVRAGALAAARAISRRGEGPR